MTTIKTAFDAFKAAETKVAEGIAVAGKAKLASLEITAGTPVGAGAAFAVAVVAQGKTAEGISGLLNDCGLYAFFAECGKIAGPMPNGKARTAGVYYGESAFRKALENRGFSLSVAKDTVTAKAMPTKEEKAAAKEKAAKDAKETAEKALADAVAKATEKASGIPVDNLPEAMAALIACHGIKAVAGALNDAFLAAQKAAQKAEKAAQKAAQKAAA